MAAWHQDARWKALRLAAKRRDGWRCVRCGGREGLEVDHIQPREKRPDLAWSLDNLQTLDRKCHLTKTAEERGVNVDPKRKEWRDAVFALSKGRG